ncbi:MAG: carboxypeptidase regulatory-like domain-containing protein [Bryobacteraceae bacterium]|jgi:hypothetical protein
MISFVRLLALGLVLAAPGFAQGSGTCTVTGTVYDPSGAVVPSANVQLALETTGTSRATVADTSGFFSFVGIPPGTYDVKVESSGFTAFLQKGFVLHVNDQVDLKGIVLKLASTGTAVEVTAETPVVPVSSGETSYTLGNKQVDELAIVGRNAVELLKIIPGAQNSGGWNGQYNGEVAAFNAGAGAYTVNGTRFDQMAIVSDGGNVIDHGFNGGAMVTPNVEMVQEVKVETSNYSAENPNGPIVMETVTKSGGKDFHGTGYYNVRDSSMNANDWQNNRYGLAKPASRFQYPGFNVGGPVLLPGTNFNKQRDKLFFFTGFEWMRQAVDLGVHRAVVPTAAMRKGDFSDTAYMQTLLPSIISTPVCQGASLPSYCSGQGVINPSAIDPGGSVLMNVYPLPNANPASSGGYNYLSDIVNPQPRDQQLVKIDYNLTDNTHFSARYNHEGESVPFPYGLWQQWPQIPYPGGVVTTDHSHSLALNLTHTFSPTVTNQLTFTANNLFYGAHLSTPDKVSASKLGYPYYGVYNNGLDIIPNVGGDPGVGDIYNEGGVVPNQDTPKWTYTLSEDVSKAWGTHLIKAGFYMSHETWQQRTGDNNYIDQGGITLASWNSLTGNGYADLVMGHVSMFTQGTQGLLLDFRANEYDFYLLDTWKVGRRLTLNYGIRMDHIGWWYNTQGDIAIFNPAKYVASAPISSYTGIQTHANDPSVSLSGYKPVSFQPAPSVGFAYDLTGSGKTVLRGGFGTNYFRDEGISAGFKLVQNPPLQTLNYISPWPGIYLSQLSSTVPAASAPWPNVAMANESTMPHTYSYSFAVQRQLPTSTLLNLAYVGNTSKNLVGWPDINPVPQGSETGQDWPGSWMDQPHRQYQNIAGIYPAAHTLRSNYNSLQVSASRTKGAVNYWLSYTFSKALGNNSADSFDMSRTYGPLPWDRSQSVKLAYNIALPAFSKKYLGNHPGGNILLDGWQVSGNTEFDSGAPVFVVGPSFPGGLAISMMGTGDLGGVHQLGGRYIVGTPDETAVPVLVCNPTSNLGPQQIFNPACFQSPTPGNNGNYVIPYIHGPWYNNSDLSLFKNFQMGESRKLQFRAEAFNFLNHPLWGFTSSGSTSNDPALRLMYDAFGAAATNVTTAGIMTNKFGHRIVQLELKFYF